MIWYSNHWTEELFCNTNKHETNKKKIILFYHLTIILPVILTSVWIGLSWAASSSYFLFRCSSSCNLFWVHNAFHFFLFFTISRVCVIFCFVALKNNAFLLAIISMVCLIFVFFNKIIFSFSFPFNLSVNFSFFISIICFNFVNVKLVSLQNEKKKTWFLLLFVQQ